MGQGVPLSPGQWPQPLRSHPPALQRPSQGCRSAPQPAYRYEQKCANDAKVGELHRAIAQVSVVLDKHLVPQRKMVAAYRDALKDLTDALKAALVLMALGEEIASDLFGRLGKEEIYALNRGMHSLSRIKENRQQEVLLEFYELCKTSNPFLLGTGNAFIRSMVERSRCSTSGSRSRRSIPSRISAESKPSTILIELSVASGGQVRRRLSFWIGCGRFERPLGNTLRATTRSGTTRASGTG